MELSVLQLVVTAVVIAGSAGVALMCDYLKSKNDQLREEMLEMQERHESETKLAFAARPFMPAAAPAAPPAPAPVASEAIPPAAPARPPIARPASAPVASPTAATQPATAGNGRNRTVRKDADPTDGLVRKSTPPAKRPAAATASVPAHARPATAARSVAAPARPAAAAATAVAPRPQPVSAAAAASRANGTAAQDSLGEWLSRRAAARASKKSAAPAAGQNGATETDLRFGLIRGAAANSPFVAVPGGMCDTAALNRMLEMRKPFAGLVVSIGVSDTAGCLPRNQDLMNATSGFIGSLLEPKDFGCRTAEDEFLVICPGLTGADAQRRLNHLAERLWDFQLRGVGAFTILFSWGGVTAQSEPLSESIASAKERMLQTKRGRKTVSLASAIDRRKAV